MNDGEISATDVIGRSRYFSSYSHDAADVASPKLSSPPAHPCRYFMCPDNEDLHSALSRILLG